MTGKRAYTYTVLRYRHDPLAGEFANVGVVLHEPASGYLDAKMRHCLRRLSRMFPDLRGEALETSLHDIEQAIQNLTERDAGDGVVSTGDVAAFAKRILPDDDSSLVWGPIGSGVTDDPALTLERLYMRLVAQYDEPPSQTNFAEG